MEFYTRIIGTLKKLPQTEFYRIALSFPEDIIFFDIETTDLSRYYDQITLIGWSFLDKYGVCYKGLEKKELKNAFNKFKCIVSYNGTLFDIPLNQMYMPLIFLPLEEPEDRS